MDTVIDIRDLTKTYGAVKALDGLTLSIPRGGVYGILGPNGAGKSTLFRTLLGLISPTSGEATVMGGRIGDPAATRRMGSMIETPRFPPFMTARQVLEWLARAHGGVSSAEIADWLQRVGLTEAANRRVKGFSVGMADVFVLFTFRWQGRADGTRIFQCRKRFASSASIRGFAAPAGVSSRRSATRCASLPRAP